MKRKVIQTAGKTMIVSLPSDWVKKFNIQKGDELDLTEKNKKLEISIEKIKESTKILKLDFSDFSKPVIKHTVSILHKMGFVELHIKYKTDDQYSILENTVESTLLGYEIVNKTNDSCVIKSIAKIDESELDNIIKKNFFVILECSKTFLEIVNKEDFKHIDKIKEYEIKNNKLTNYCHRIINLLHEEQGSKFSYYYLILWELENLCDEFKYLAEFLNKNKSAFRIFKQKVSLFIQTDKLINSYYSLFYKFDIKRLESFINDCEKTKVELITLLGAKGHQKEEYFIIFSSLEIIKSLRSLVGSTLILQYLNTE